MISIRKLMNRSYGKNNKWVTYNSTFRDGVSIGHIYSIAQSMNVHVIPNRNQGLVIGIGLPNRKEDFPEYNPALAAQDPDYVNVRADIVRRFLDEGEHMTFFRRVYELDAALRGKLPMLDGTRKILESQEVNFSPVPFDMVITVPKPSHVIYPEKYDAFFAVDYSGQFEPATADIANQYIFIPKSDGGQDGWTMGRVNQKLAEKRNIQVTAVSEETVPGLVRRSKVRRLIPANQREAFEKKYRDTQFEVALMPNSDIDIGQMQLIYETMNDAEKKGSEAVFAIPYLKAPRRRGDFGLPFRRALKVRDFIHTEYRSVPEKLDNKHITFVETDNDGRFELTPSTASYLPEKFTVHRYKRMFTEIPAMSDIDLRQSGLEHLGLFS